MTNPGPMTAGVWARVSTRTPARQALLARLAVTPLIAVGGLITARLVVGSTTEAGYGIYALAWSIPVLIPISDFGIGAGLIELTSGRDKDPAAFRDAVHGALRRLWLLTVVITLVGLAFLAPGVGGTLGFDSADQRASVCLALVSWALTLPMSVGQRILVGASRTDVMSLTLGIPPVLNVCMFTVLTSLTRPPVAVFVALAGLSPLMAMAAGNRAARRATGLGVGALIVSAPFRRAGPYAARGIAVPMFVISTALPIAYTSDRYVLKLVSGEHAVAVYSSVMQVATPALALVSTGGMVLWGRFAAVRSAGGVVTWPALRTLTARYSLAACGLAGLLVVVGPLCSAFVLHRPIGYDPQIVGLFALAAAFIIAQATQYPSGMILTTRSGLRFQAGWAAAMMIGNLALSVVLTHAVGVSGPLIATVVVFLLTLFVASILRARRETLAASSATTAPALHDQVG